MHRLAISLMFFLMPRLLPRILRFLRLVWRLTFDKRVPLVLRALVPLAVLYALSPLPFLIPDSLGVPGWFDDLIILGLATLFLTKLAPRHVVDELRGVKPANDSPQEKDPSKIVDGSSHLIDED